MEYKDLVQSMTGLREALEITQKDLCLSHASREENLCEWIVPRLEFYLIETLKYSKEFLTQMKSRLFHPWLMEMENSLRKLYVLIRKVEQGLKMEIENFSQSKNGKSPNSADHEKEVNDYVQGVLSGEKPVKPWKGYSLNHLEACMLLLKESISTFQDMEHVADCLTEEKVNCIAENAYCAFKNKQLTVGRNYLEALKDELDGDLPDKHFMAEKLKELRSESGPAELVQLAQNYQGNWPLLIEAMKEKGYQEMHLQLVFMYYLKKEILSSLKSNKINLEDVKRFSLDNPQVRQALAQSIVQLQEEQIQAVSDKTEYPEKLFNQKNHWIAIFRVLADKGWFQNTDYKGFALYMQALNSGKFRIPCEYEAVKKITKTIFTQALSSWHYDAIYHKSREPYERMLRVANRYMEIFKQYFPA